MEKLQIAEHFNSIINDIDLATETKINQDQRLEDFCNDRRQKQIDVVREIEKIQLLRLKTGKTIEEQYMSAKEICCFVVEYADLWFLATVNRQVREEEMYLFKTLVTWLSYSYRKRLDMLIGDDYLDDDEIYVESVLMNIDIGFDLSPFRTTNSEVVDVSTWFDRQFHVEEIEFNLKKVNYHKVIFGKPINSLLRIKTLRILLEVDDSVGLDDIETINIVDRAVKCFGKVDSVVVEIRYEKLDESIISEFVESLRSNCSHEKLSILINALASDDSFPRDLSFVNYLKRIVFIQPDLRWFPTVNWSSLNELVFRVASFQDLESTDLGSLRSLKRLEIMNSKRQQPSTDMTFLDPVRESLEELTLGGNHIKCLSWKMFRGMHQLKKLMIQEDSVAKLELDDQGQLFFDLHNLQSLCFDLNSAIMSTEWKLYLSDLKRLVLYSVSANQANSLISFNLPKLNYLSLDSSDSRLAPLLNDAVFYRVEELRLSLSDPSFLRNGYLRKFKSLKKLKIISNHLYVDIDGDSFVGLEHLVELSLEDIYPKPGTLSRLENLKKITLVSHRDFEFESLLDGLVSLKELKISEDYWLSSEQFVYLENLKKFVFKKYKPI